MHEWSDNDAWVLAALGGTSADSPASLAEVIAHADALEHHIIEESEFAGAAGRLIAAGLMSADAGAYWRTPAGRQLYLAQGRKREALLKALRKQGEPPIAEPLVLPAGEFDLAADEYSEKAGQAS